MPQDLEKAARGSIMGRIGSLFEAKQKKEEPKVAKAQKPYTAPPKARGPYWGVAKEEPKPQPKRKRSASKY